MLKFLRHEGEKIAIEHRNRQHALTRRLRCYVKPGRFLIDWEVQRWQFTNLISVKISRPVLRNGRPLGNWRLVEY
ncbi:hypothetical protein D3875_21385 [Deinococcus cavernae]|uniref:Uncharacterized protein n=1 Tax=Deinococcus cavernae TaxID=2320857 RepID=A0A418UZL0_9DEIO|nr:hypothetical protein [Deinococcus cavernae]RJF68907.1 hypothetical protein D3875_21385 [Deinococcus cavernae]